MNTPELKNSPAEAVTILELGQTFDEISKSLLLSSTDLSEKGIAFIKKYPLHSTMVAGGIGFLLGSIISRK